MQHPQITIDHPLIRRSCECPLCGGKKDVGLVACWPCYRAVLKPGLAWGEKRLDQVETRLIDDLRLVTP